MWKKKLKKKKLQFFIIGILLMFGTAILSACINVGIQISNLTDEVYDNNKFDFCMLSSKGTSKLLEDSVDNLKNIQCYKMEEVLAYHDDTSISDFNSDVYFIALDDYTDMDWKIIPIEKNSNENGPKEGEIWIQKIIADAHDVKVGDKYVIDNDNKDELEVTALVNDAMKPNTMASGQYIYMNENDFDKINGNKEVDFSLINSNMTKDELQSKIDSQFAKNDILYLILSSENTKAPALTINGLVTGLGIISSICMLLITIIIIRFFVRSTILSEYGAIGTYKSLGYTTKDIIGFYSKCYAIVGLVASTVGSFTGILLSYFMGNIITEYITKYKIAPISIIIALIVAAAVFGLLFINLRLALRRIKKITPVDAFRIGTTSSKSKMKRSFIKNASSSFATAINDLFKYKGRSVLIILVVTVAFYISLVFLNMCYSFETIDDKASAWVGVPTSHCCIGTKDANNEVSNEILEYLDNNKYVDHYVYGSIGVHEPVDCLQSDISLKTANVMSFNTYEDGKYNVNYATGRPPENCEEIGIDYASLENSSLEIGDYIKLKINDKEDSFLITGTFNTVGNTAALHMMNSYFDNNNIKVKDCIAIYLNNKSDFDEFKNDIEENFNDYNVKKITEYIGDVKNSIQAIMIPVTIMIIVIFLMFTMLIITNLIITSNKQNEKNFGIMKAYGFTTGYIIRRNVFRIGILSAIGITLSVILNKLITAKVFWMSLGCDGFNMSIPYTVIFATLGYLVIILLTILLSAGIRKISPKELMEE